MLFLDYVKISNLYSKIQTIICLIYLFKIVSALVAFNHNQETGSWADTQQSVTRRESDSRPLHED